MAVITKKNNNTNKQNIKWVRQQQNILSAGERQFWKKGFMATSIEDIATAAHVNKATIYYYFKSKSSLLNEICRSGVSSLLDSAKPVWRSDLPSEQKLRTLILNHISWLAAKPEIARIVQAERRNLPPKFQREIIYLRDEYENIFREVVRETLGKQPSLLTNLNLSTMFIIGLMNSTSLWYRKNGEQSSEQIAFEVWMFISRALGIIPGAGDSNTTRVPNSQSIEHERTSRLY